MIDPLRVRQRLSRHTWAVPIRLGASQWGYRHRNERGASVVVSEETVDGDEWTHASIAWKDRMPTYNDLKHLKQAVFEDGYAYQVFPPAGQHINNHEHALHLFGRSDGKPALPDFTFWV